MTYGVPVVPDFDDPTEKEIERQDAAPLLRVVQSQPSPRPARKATPYVAPPPHTIPPRRWLHGRHYMRGIVSATVAPGGFGKTTLSLHEALCMACDELRVWYISAEDDIDELHRRIAAHLLRHKISPHEIVGKLFVDDKMTFPLKIARAERSNTIVFDDATLTAFEQAIVSARIDVVTLDPFISFHAVPENDTSAMDAVVKRLGEIAARCKCNIELSHHVRKPSSGAGSIEITVYDARGAGSIVNAVRSCRVLNQMSKATAEQLSPPIADKDRCRYIRIDNGKRNMAPPEAAHWMQLLNVEIGNGDFVQALDHFELRVQATNLEEDKIWLQNLIITHGPFRASSQSPNWLGVPMAKHFDRDHASESDKKWLHKIIKKWEQAKFIKKKELKDERRKKCLHWALGDNAIPPPIITEETTNGEDD
jgi:AAA domain